MDAERFTHVSSLISQVNGEETGETLSAYSSSPETVFGAAYLAILPSHRLLHGSSSVRSALEKTFQAGRGERLYTDPSLCLWPSVKVYDFLLLRWWKESFLFVFEERFRFFLTSNIINYFSGVR